MGGKGVEYQASIMPILFSADQERSSEYYADRLGFLVRDEDDGLCIRYAEFAFRVLPAADADLASNIGAVFHVARVNRLYRRFLRQRVPALSDLRRSTLRPARFSLRDPDGNTLYFVDKTAGPGAQAAFSANQHRKTK